MTSQEAKKTLLPDSLSMYEDLVSNIPCGVYRFRMKASGGWKFDFVNRRFCDLTGLDREDVLNDHEKAFRIIHPDDLNTFISLNESAEKTLAPFMWEGRAIVHGETRWMRAESRPTLMDNGDVVWSGYFTDITDRKRVEQELRNFKTIADQANYGCAIHDFQGYLTYVNEAFARMHGFFSQEVIGKNLSVFHDDEQMEHVNGLLEQLKREGGFEFQEVWHVKKDGTAFLTLMSASVIRGAEGAPLFLSATAIDITARKRAEDQLNRVQLQLKASRDNYRDLYDFAPVGYFTLTQKGIIQEVNMMGATLLGTTCSKLIGQGFQRFIAHDSLELWFQHVLEARLEGVTQSQDFWLKRKDGATCCVSLESLSMVVPAEPKNDNKGQKVIRVAITDITERKRTEEELKRSEERFRSMFERHSAVMLLIEPKTGRIIDANIAAERFYGYSISQICSKFIQDIDVSSADVGENERNLALQERRNYFVFSHLLANGEVRTVEVHSSPIEQNGNPILFSVIHDITERERAERALRDSEQFLRQSEKIARIGGWRANPFTNRLHWTDGVYDILEAPRDYFPDFEEGGTFFVPEHRPTIREAIENLLNHGNPFKLEAEILTSSGKRRWTEMRGLIREEEGKEPQVVGCFQDITERKAIEDALKESEQRYRTVADFTYDWEYWINSEGNFLYVSPSCERISGYTAREFIDDPDLMSRIIHPDDRKAMLDHYHLVRKVFPGTQGTRDFRIIHRDGETRWIGHVCQPVYGQKGQLIGRRGSNRDITERKLTQEILEAEKEKLRGILHSMNDGVCIVNSHNDIEYVNPVIEASFGDVTGRNCYEYFHDRTESCPWCKNQEVSAGESVNWQWYSSKTGRTYEVFDTPLKNPDGSISKLEIFHDITERKQSEEKNLMLATIVDSSDDAIIGNTLDGIVTSWNKGAERSFGYKEHEVIGKNISILAPNDRKHEPQGFLEQIKSGKSVKNVETVRQRKDGANIPVCLTVSPIIDEKGGVVGASAIVRDISDRVKAEQQRDALQSQFFQAQKMEAVGILAGGVAHDFNNLLQAVIGYSELLLNQKKPGDPEFEDIQRIYDSGKRGADLVKSLLMFSRKVQPELRPIDLNHEIAQVQKLLSHSIPKTIKIDLRLSETLELVLADPSQTGQVIMNLAINARDAMPDGGTLTIETANVELDEAYCAIDTELSPGAYVLITVSDTGQGMDEETLSHVFEPFFTTKEKGKGTGLGLATVYGIVKQHNGHITCYSELEYGTTFEIYLPAIQTDKAPGACTEAGPIQGGTETILLVDDEEAIRGLGTRLLNKFGYKVVTANDGKEALEIYQREGNSISLIILDLIMPVMDGKKCLAEILRVNPKSRVVLASGHSESGLASGATTRAKGFVKKPYDMWQLLTKIRDILDAD